MLLMLSHARAKLRPTKVDWADERASGWYGSDGSSCSFDSLFGVEIGKSSAAYHPELPANLHDFRYRVIRRLRALELISDEQAEELRLLADLEHYDGLCFCVDAALALGEIWKATAIAAKGWAWVRFRALRALGGNAAHPNFKKGRELFIVLPEITRESMDNWAPDGGVPSGL